MRRLSALLCLLFLACTFPAQAQDQNDGTLHVLRPLVHSEQEDAELCLQFDHDLNVTDRRRAAGAVKLELSGKPVAVTAQSISIAGDLLCLSALGHHKEYRLVVNGLRGAKGEKQAGTYSLGFSIPDRQSSLAFAGAASSGGFIRWEEGDPTLRALNVPQVSLELFRVSDPSSMSAAWRERRQAALAPSESATFAHDHGQSAWSGTAAIDGDTNKITEQKIPLHASFGNPQPGVYLAVARAPETKSESLTATGALWILRSELRIGAVRDATGFYALAEKADGTGPIKDVRLTVEDANGQKLAEGKSDGDGVAHLQLPADKQNAATLLAGFTDAGDSDFADLTKTTNRFAPTGTDDLLSTDESFYAPGANATVNFVEHDAQGHAVADAGTSLQLLWPDNSPYTTFPVPAANGALAPVSFSVPGAGGNWNLVWKRGDGTVLAQTNLRVTSNPEAPRFDINADRALLPANGEVNLKIKSLTSVNTQIPYLTGRLFVSWQVPDHIFQEFKDYRFGKGASAGSDSAPVASFITDEKGEATLHLLLAPPDDGAPLHATVLHVQSNDSQDIGDSEVLTLPLKPKDIIVGIKPLAADGRFTENGLARFSVIALDADGHRQNAGELTYQIYEEGRSFEWHQSEGKWNYKPLQQTRRIGGDALTLSAAHDNIIEWPVTAGNYRLEISDANGVVQASFGFSAGWGSNEAAPAPAALPLASATVLHPGQEARLHFNLDRPGMVSIFIGDDRIRKLVHRIMQKGENIFTFTPEKDWGSRIVVRVQANDFNRLGQLILPLLPAGQTITETPVPKGSQLSEIFMINPRLPQALRTGDAPRLEVDLKNNGKVAATYHFTLTAPPGVKSFGLSETVANLGPGQSRAVGFNMLAGHAGSVSLKLDINAPPHFHEVREWTIPIRGDDVALAPAAQQRIEARQSWTVLPEKSKPANEDNLFFLAPAPLFHAPLFLSSVVAAHPFTIGEIVGVMETLRLWRDTILAAGLQPEGALNAQQHSLLLRLLARQKPDGSFAPTPTDAANLVSTARALVALARTDEAAAKPAEELAATWLRHRLENTWFDEKERPDRAAVYAALAAAGRLDSASLHYFGDTSADKALPPSAAAQLAFAFAISNDQGKASFWLDASGVRKNPDEQPLSLLPVLAANGFLDPQILLPAFQKISDGMVKSNARDLESMTNLLRATAIVQQRSDGWHVTVNTDKRSLKGVLVMPVKSATAIYNTGDGPLFLVRTRQTGGAAAGPVARHIYQLNGSEVENSAVTPGHTYLVVLEGPWPGKEGGALALVHDDLSAGLAPSGCLPPAPIAADDALAWLRGQSFSLPAACEIWGGGIDMMITRKEKTSSWRAAYLAKAESGGSFSLMPPSVRNLESNQENLRGSKIRLDVR